MDWNWKMKLYAPPPMDYQTIKILFVLSLNQWFGIKKRLKLYKTLLRVARIPGSVHARAETDHLPCIIPLISQSDQLLRQNPELSSELQSVSAFFLISLAQFCSL